MLRAGSSHALVPISIVLCALAAACGGTSFQDNPSVGTVIWQGRSGAYTITMREDDIVAHDASGQCYSARKDGLSNRRAEGKPPISPEAAQQALQKAGCTGFEQAMVISVVGPIMSMFSYSTVHCPMYALTHARYSSFDLSRQTEELLLTDFFDSTDVFRALMADSLVRWTLAHEEWGIAAPPINSLSELIDRLCDVTTECEYQFTKDLLRRFAFHHIEGENVVVELGLDLGINPCQQRPAALTLLLPIPVSLAGALEHAANGTQGILKREMEYATARSTGAILMKL